MPTEFQLIYERFTVLKESKDMTSSYYSKPIYLMNTLFLARLLGKFKICFNGLYNLTRVIKVSNMSICFQVFKLPKYSPKRWVQSVFYENPTKEISLTLFRQIEASTLV